MNVRGWNYHSYNSLMPPAAACVASFLTEQVATDAMSKGAGAENGRTDGHAAAASLCLAMHRPCGQLPVKAAGTANAGLHFGLLEQKQDARS